MNVKEMTNTMLKQKVDVFEQYLYQEQPKRKFYGVLKREKRYAYLGAAWKLSV